MSGMVRTPVDIMLATVDPLIVPVPELSPGPHRVELEILGIRPKEPPDEGGVEHHGYWVLSVLIVADEPWPEE